MYYVYSDMLWFRLEIIWKFRIRRSLFVLNGVIGVDVVVVVARRSS